MPMICFLDCEHGSFDLVFATYLGQPETADVTEGSLLAEARKGFKWIN